MLRRTIAFIIISCLSTSCKDVDNDDMEQNQLCDSSNTTFNQIYNIQLNALNNIEYNTIDLETHAYTFEVISEAKICGIGYRSQPTFEIYPYLIEIHDNTNDAIVYSSSHTFSSIETEYVYINSLTLVAGNSYTIKRIQTNYTNDITIYIGRLIRNSNNEDLNFPFYLDNLKITSASFGLGSSISNYYFGLPYIDIVFE